MALDTRFAFFLTPFLFNFLHNSLDSSSSCEIKQSLLGYFIATIDKFGEHIQHH